MLGVMYFGLALIGLAFFIGLYKLWRAHRRMAARERVLNARMMEAADSHRKAAREGLPESGRPAQGSLWEE